MSRRVLALGEQGTIEATPQKRDTEGRWKRHPQARGADRWRARVSVRGTDGVVRELCRFAPTRVAAERALAAALADHKAGESVEMTSRTPFVRAGELWLEGIKRSDSRLSQRTILDYGRTWTRCIDVEGSALRGLSVAEANSPQRLRAFLQTVADKHGTGSAKIVRSVLMGVLTLALDNGVVQSNALRQVRQVQAQQKRPTDRDTRRAFTKAERDAVVAYADSLAAVELQAPQTRRKAETTADMVATLAGTGMRVGEARALRWEHVDLDAGVIRVHGTKSAAALRGLTLPSWLAQRLCERWERLGQPRTGYVFAAPGAVHGQDQPWDQSNCSGALRVVLTGAGFPTVTPHVFRRSAASIAHTNGAPLAAIADQLGHSDPSMTARVYLGRDPFGDRSCVAQWL